MSQTNVQERSEYRNGVDVAALFRTLEAVRADKELAKFRFRARNEWIMGGHNRSRIKEFYGARQEHRTGDEVFVLDNDEPPVLLGKDVGANPVEYVLHALAGCLTTTIVYHAAARGIAIEAVNSELEGELDLRGFLGLSNQVRKGYHDIRVRMRVKSEAPPETLAALARYSPVYDIVSNSVPVQVMVETY